jgi:hypothetical protein
MRRFRIRNAAAEIVGEGVELLSNQIAARLPFEISGAAISGDFSQWEDAEVATRAVEAIGLHIEWLAADTWAWDWEPFPSATHPAYEAEPAGGSRSGSRAAEFHDGQRSSVSVLSRKTPVSPDCILCDFCEKEVDLRTDDGQGFELGYVCGPCAKEAGIRC